MDEKRKPLRYLVEGMGIYAKTMFNTEVEVLELSVSGALVRGAERFLIGCEYIFRIEHRGRIIPVNGVIAWKRVTTERDAGGKAIPVYTAGIEFLDVFTDKAEQIRGLINENIQELKDRRLSGVRVKVKPPEKALLTSIETCEIKDISSGGMRIEVEDPLPVDMLFDLELILARNEDAIHCQGRIAFCREALEKMPKRFSVGVDLKCMVDSDKERLEQFIETLS
jgi:hypothetical protein